MLPYKKIAQMAVDMAAALQAKGMTKEECMALTAAAMPEIIDEAKFGKEEK
jgi:hypothetical protein